MSPSENGGVTAVEVLGVGITRGIVVYGISEEIAKAWGVGVVVVIVACLVGECRVKAVGFIGVGIAIPDVVPINCSSGIGAVVDSLGGVVGEGIP